MKVKTFYIGFLSSAEKEINQWLESQEMEIFKIVATDNSVLVFYKKAE